MSGPPVRSRLAGRTIGVALVLLAGISSTLVACSGSRSPAPAVASGTGCVAQPSDQLVMLTDDRRSQNSDNVVPVATTSLARPPLTTALDAVSAALSQDELQGLNRAVGLDGADRATAARDFVSRRNLVPGLSGGRGRIVVADAGFSESVVLANVYATVLRKVGYDAVVRDYPKREALEPALESGQAQVSAEYAASLTDFLAKQANGAAAHPSNDIDRTLAVLRPLASRQDLTVLEPAAANDQNAFAVTRATADALGVTTLSQLARRCPGGVSFGGPPECPQRPFCQAALAQVYGLRVTAFSPLDADGPRTRQALQQGRVLLAEVFSADADILPAAG